MPSDDRTQDAVRALAAARETFLSAVSAAAEGVRGLIAAGESLDGNGERAARELGAFAAGRVDPARFGKLFAGSAPLEAAAVDALGLAYATLNEIRGAGEDAFVVRVAGGESLAAAVLAALARLGRAFGAGHVAELARSGRYRADEHAGYLAGYAPELWNRAERQVAPPLVVDVDGAALRGVGGLAEALQGLQKIVLVVRGACPPAPLARLITPDVFVMQTPAAGALDRVARSDAPAIGALVPEGAAAFAHDPAKGAWLADRLTVEFAPVEPPRQPIPGYTPFLQAEELRQLAALTAEAVRPAAAAGPTQAEEVTPADKLAAWLLRQANLIDA